MLNSKQQFKTDQAFTLIEVLVATAILAFSSMLTYQVMINSFDVNQKLSYESGTMLSIAIATDTLDRDISQLYSPLLGKVDPPKNNIASEFWSPPQRRDGLRRTRFQGSKEKISFVSASNRRIQKNSALFELHKVTWEIIRQKDGGLEVKRLSDTNVFDYDDEANVNKEAQNFTILENLKTAEFSFYNLEREKWETRWDSEGNRVEEKSRFPSIVRIKFSIENPDNEKDILEWESKFVPILPLNFVDPADGVLR